MCVCIYIYTHINIRTARKPAQRFDHFYVQPLFLSLENVGIATCLQALYMWVICTAILLGSMKHVCFTAVGAKKCMFDSPRIRYIF